MEGHIGHSPSCRMIWFIPNFLAASGFAGMYPRYTLTNGSKGWDDQNKMDGSEG